MGLRDAVRLLAVVWGVATSLPLFLAGCVTVYAILSPLIKSLASASLDLVLLLMAVFAFLSVAITLLNAFNWWKFYRKEKGFHPLATSVVFIAVSALWFFTLILVSFGGLEGTPQAIGILVLLQVQPLLFSIPNLVFTILAWKKMI